MECKKGVWISKHLKPDYPASIIFVLKPILIY